MVCGSRSARAQVELISDWFVRRRHAKARANTAGARPVDPRLNALLQDGECAVRTFLGEGKYEAHD